MTEAELLKAKFLDECRYSSRKATNFIMSHIDTTAAHTSGKKLYTGIFAILDTNFNILYRLNTEAYIHSCGISGDGKYAILNTARSKPVSDDSEKCIFIDIEKKKILWKIKEDTKSGAHIISYHIDTNAQIITIHYQDHDRRLDFQGNLIA